MSNKIVNIIAIGVAAALAIVLLVRVAFQGGINPTQSPDKPPVPFTQYTNDSYGFSISYPQDWVDDPNKGEYDIFKVKKPLESTAAAVSVWQALNEKSLVDRSDGIISYWRNIGYNPVTIISQSKTTLADNITTAYEIIFEATKPNASTKAIELSTFNGGAAVKFGCYTSPKNYTENESLLKKIIYSLKLTNPGPVLKEVELKYDSGKARDFYADLGGYLVDFTPPAGEFTIKKLRVLGMLAGSPKEQYFVAQLWDKDKKVIYDRTLPVSMFSEAANVIDIDIPSVKVKDKFYVHIYIGTGRLQGIHIGVDDSVPNLHSAMTTRTADGKYVERPWDPPSSLWLADKQKANWMIRAVGTYQ